MSLWCFKCYQLPTFIIWRRVLTLENYPNFFSKIYISRTVVCTSESAALSLLNTWLCEDHRISKEVWHIGHHQLCFGCSLWCLTGRCRCCENIGQRRRVGYIRTTCESWSSCYPEALQDIYRGIGRFIPWRCHSLSYCSKRCSVSAMKVSLFCSRENRSG